MTGIAQVMRIRYDKRFAYTEKTQIQSTEKAFVAHGKER